MTEACVTAAQHVYRMQTRTTWRLIMEHKLCVSIFQFHVAASRRLRGVVARRRGIVGGAACGHVAPHDVTQTCDVHALAHPATRHVPLMSPKDTHPTGHGAHTLCCYKKHGLLPNVYRTQETSECIKCV